MVKNGRLLQVMEVRLDGEDAKGNIELKGKNMWTKERNEERKSK